MKKYLSCLFLFFVSSSVFSQITIKELPLDISYSTDTVNYANTSTRTYIPLNNDWNVYVEDSKETSVLVNVPSSFKSGSTIIYEKALDIQPDLLEYNFFRIHFMGISYLVDIYLNDLILVKKTGGNIPFTLDLPSELINIENNNVITLKIIDELDSKSTIPLHQRFLLPKHSGGILREVFLEIIPKEHVELLDYSAEFNSSLTRANLNFDFSFNYIYEKKDRPKYRLAVTLVDNLGNLVYERKLVPDKTQKLASHNINLRDINLWSPETPNLYTANFQLTKNDSVVDEIEKNLALFTFEESESGFKLNSKEITFQGVSYIISDEKLGSLIGYQNLKEDLNIIKNMGVNSVRFSGDTPHPFALDICQKLGLFAFIEIPLNSVPANFTNDSNFKDRAIDYFKDLYRAYEKHKSVLGIGLGSGYIADSTPQSEFISELAEFISNEQKISYASFIGFPENQIENLDLYGVELFSPDMSSVTRNIENSVSILGNHRVFISSATYPSYNGNTNGYLNKFSIEGQAKFFEETIDLYRTSKLTGFFINSMFDFYGDFNSLYSKFSPNNFYQIGILGADRNINRIGYNVIQSKLEKSNRITIPLGSKEEDAPLFFIFMGLALSIFMGVLVNSKKKFREDAMRALLRPYNFFADIRDHRIMSGVHTAILLVILLGAHALLLNNLFFYLRTNLFFDKVLIAFGNPAIIDFVSYFAWNPIEAFFLLFILTAIDLVIVSLIIKWASFFIRTKIYYRNIVFTIVWAFLPVVILLPLTMVLYRILEAEIITLYLFAFLFLYFIWTFQRLLKGIYVIFDVGSFRVYFYTIVILIILIGGILSYFQLSYSTFDYITNTFYQFKQM